MQPSLVAAVFAALFASSEAVLSSEKADQAFETLLLNQEVELTPAEREAFRGRFLKSVANAEEGFFDDEVALVSAFIEEMPAVYESMVKKIQEEATTWKSVVHPKFAELSMKEARDSLFGNAAGAENDDWNGGFIKYILDFKKKDRNVYDDRYFFNPTEIEGIPPLKHERDVDLPESFNAVEEWPECYSIGEVEDQGLCGSCYAVSAASVITDRLCIATKGKFREPISAQYIVSCMPRSVSHGCEGGFPQLAFKEFSNAAFPTGARYNSKSPTCYPYEIEPARPLAPGEKLPTASACSSECTDGSFLHTMDWDAHRVEQVRGSGVVVNRLVDEYTIMKEVMLRGPVEAGFYVAPDIMTYGGGVYAPTSQDFRDFFHFSYHAVRIIGWGVENGEKYWLIANSWGRRYGENGLLKYKKGLSGISKMTYAISFPNAEAPASNEFFLA